MLAFSLHAQAPPWLWSRSAQGTGIDEAFALTTTPQGHIVIGGESFSPEITFGSVTLTNRSSGLLASSLFLACYDASGNLLWARNAGDGAMNRITALTSDPQGHIIAVGEFGGNTLTLENFTLSNQGYYDVFIAKYDPAGNLLWIKSIGGPEGEAIRGVATDPSGHIYITGWFYSPTLSFGPITLNEFGNRQGDLFLAKLSPRGEFLWARAVGGDDLDAGMAVATCTEGEVIVAGYFRSHTLSPGTASFTDNGRGNFFLAKFDARGQLLWARRAGGSENDLPYGLICDQAGNIAMAGTFWSETIAFEGLSLTNRGSCDLFVAKYASDGRLLWAQSAGGPDCEDAYGLTTDSAGCLYVAGQFTSPQLKLGSLILRSAGGADVLVLAYDSTGQLLWAQKAGGESYEIARAIARDNGGALYVGGYYMSLRIAFGSSALPEAQVQDAFVAKLSSQSSSLAVPAEPSLRIIPHALPGLYCLRVEGMGAPAFWRVISLSGYLVARGWLDAASEAIIDLSDQPAGVYGVLLEEPGSVRVEKVFHPGSPQ